MKKNYQLMLDRTIAEIEAQTDGKRPSLLLHACCAPCSSYVLEYLSSHFDITLFFYNPNITSEEEYLYRVNEVKRLISQMPLDSDVKFVEGKYDVSSFIEIAKGLESMSHTMQVHP